MKDINKLAKIPPLNPNELSSPEILAKKLKKLIGHKFNFTGKARTDGSNFRKLVTQTLMSDNPPLPASEDDYTILPPKSKGVPAFLREYIDTYIVTTGENYNLQVWNRNPNSDFIQIEYQNGNKNLTAKDVTFVFGKINIEEEIIESIIVTSPDRIVQKFGNFGVPTSKQQLIVSDKKRHEIINSRDNFLFHKDDDSLLSILNEHQNTSKLDIKSTEINELLPLNIILNRIKDIIGTKLIESSTKLKGQELERIIASKLGYKIPDKMEGGYPDLPNQMLEVKVQDSPTVDLGRYSPQSCELIKAPFTTENIRYLIAFTNKDTQVIEGFYLGPGNKLGNHFSYVSEKSVKYQRSMKMSFFEEHKGKSIVF